jgi:hypothetical protein
MINIKRLRIGLIIRTKCALDQRKNDGRRTNCGELKSYNQCLSLGQQWHSVSQRQWVWQHWHDRKQGEIPMFSCWEKNLVPKYSASKRNQNSLYWWKKLEILGAFKKNLEILRITFQKVGKIGKTRSHWHLYTSMLNVYM